MNGEHPESGPSVPTRVLRGVVALLGIGALLVAIGSFLLREPQSPAEGHALAHSLPGIMAGGIIWIGGLGLAGVILLLIAYLARRRLSAITLVLTGLVVILLLGRRPAHPVIALPLLLVVLGSYALYENAPSRGPFEFIAGTTALLWLVEFLYIAGFAFGFSDFLFSLMPFAVNIAVNIWVHRLLDAGALGILAGAAGYRYVGVPVPRIPVVLAVAILTEYLPGAVWVALSEYIIAGFDPLAWMIILVTTVSAVAILKQPCSDFVRSFGRLPR